MNKFKLASFCIFCFVLFLLTSAVQRIYSHHTPGDGESPHPDISLSNSAYRKCGMGSAHVNVNLESVSLGKVGWTYDGKAWADSGGSNPKMGENGNGVKLYCALVEGSTTYTFNLLFNPGVQTIEVAGVGSVTTPNYDAGGSKTVTKKSVLIADDKKMNLSDSDWWPDFCYYGQNEIAYAAGNFMGQDSTDSGGCQAIYVPIFNRFGVAIGSAYCHGNTSVANAMVFRR